MQPGILRVFWSLNTYNVELPINQQSWVFLFRKNSINLALNPFLYQPVFLFRIGQTQAQDLPLSIFEIPVVSIGHSQASPSLLFSVSVSLANFPKVYSIPLPMPPIKMLNSTIPILAPEKHYWYLFRHPAIEHKTLSATPSQFRVHWVVYLSNPWLSNLEIKCCVGQCQTLWTNIYRLCLLSVPNFSSIIYP